MKKRNNKVIARFAVFIYILISIFNVFFIKSSYGEEINSKGLTQSITLNKTQINSGETVELKLNYKNLQNIKAGDIIEIKVFDDFKDINAKDITYPKEHFQSVEVKNNKIILTFKELNGEFVELGGYVSILMTAKEVQSITPGTVVSKFENETSSVDYTINPKPSTGEDNVKNSLVSKTSSTGNGSNVIVADENGSVVGRTVKYTIAINEKLLENISFELIDTIPEGMKILKDKVKLYKVVDNKEVLLSNQEMNDMISYDSKNSSLNVKFNNISHKYMLKYELEIIEDKKHYNNTAKVVFEDGSGVGQGTNTQSKVDINVKLRPGNPEAVPGNNGILRKLGDNKGVVVGDRVKYDIYVNEQKKTVHNAVVNDKIPKGTKLVKDSIQIVREDQRYNSQSQPQWTNVNVTNEFKDGILENGEFTLSEDETKINVKFPSKIIEKYYVKYELEIVEAYEEYKNTSSLSFDVKTIDGYIPETVTVSKVIKFNTGAGSIGVKKSVDKSKIISDDDNIVTYDIDVISRGGFPANYVNIVDKIHEDVIVNNIEARCISADNKDVSYKVKGSFDASTNTITVDNIDRLSMGDTIKIKILTDFKNVKLGTTIKNVAKVNNEETNEVETKKGYSFEGVKLDFESKVALLDAKFELRDSNNNIVIKEINTDNEGKIYGEVKYPGKYYLIETKAPDGYIKDQIPIEITINEDNIGNKIFIGNIENKKLIQEPEVLPPQLPPSGVPDDKPQPIPPGENPDDKPVQIPPSGIPDNNNPQTGDTGTMIFVVLGVVSAVGIIIMNRKK